MKKFVAATICVVYVFLTFFYGGYSYTAITFLHLVSLTLVLVLFMRIRHSTEIAFSSSFIPIFSFLTFMVVSLIFSKTPSKSLKEFFQVANYILIYFLVLQAFSARKIDIFFKIIFSVVFLILLYAFHQKFYGYPSISEKLENLGLPSSPTRFSSLFIHPNSLAGYIILVFPPLLCYFVLAKGIFKKVVYFILISFSLLSFFFTKSYAGAISLFVSSSLFLGLSFRHKATSLKILFLFCLFFCTIVFFRMPDFSEKKKSFIGRLHFWESTLYIIIDYPQFGTGPGSFSEILPSYQRGGFYSRYAHNNYLQMASETGLFGLFCFLWMIIYFVLFFFNAKQKLSGDDRLKFISIFSAIFGCLFHLFFDFDWNIPAIAVLLFIYFAFLQIISGEIKKVSLKIYKGYLVFSKIIIVPIFLFLYFVVIKQYLAYLYFQEGEKKYTEKKYSVSSQKLKRAINLDPKNPYYLSKLAEVSFAKGDIKKAIELSKKSILLQPFSSYFYAQLGTYYYSAKDIQKAISSFKMASHFYSNTPTYYYILGSIYHREGDFTQAEIEYKNAIKLKDDYLFAGEQIKDIANSYANLALIYLSQNRIKDAKEMAHKTLEIDPHHKIKFVLDLDVEK